MAGKWDSMDKEFLFEAWGEAHTPFWPVLPLNASTYVVERLFPHPDLSRVSFFHHDLTRHWNGGLALWCIVAGSTASSPPTIQATTRSDNEHDNGLSDAESEFGQVILNERAVWRRTGWRYGGVDGSTAICTRHFSTLRFDCQRRVTLRPRPFTEAEQ
jgi:hypothetical protein